MLRFRTRISVVCIKLFPLYVIPKQFLNHVDSLPTDCVLEQEPLAIFPKFRPPPRFDALHAHFVEKPQQIPFPEFQPERSAENTRLLETDELPFLQNILLDLAENFALFAGECGVQLVDDHAELRSLAQLQLQAVVVQLVDEVGQQGFDELPLALFRVEITSQYRDQSF